MMRLWGSCGDWLLLNDSNEKQYQGTCDNEGYTCGEGVREHHFQYLKIKNRANEHGVIRERKATL
jgi:hypothetical protein